MLPVVPDVLSVTSSTEIMPLVTSVVTVAAAAAPEPSIPSSVPVKPVAVIWSVAVIASTNRLAQRTPVVPRSSVLSVSETTLPPCVVTPINFEVVPTYNAFATPSPPSVCMLPVVPDVLSVTSSTEIAPVNVPVVPASPPTAVKLPPGNSVAASVLFGLKNISAPAALVRIDSSPVVLSRDIVGWLFIFRT